MTVWNLDYFDSDLQFSCECSTLYQLKSHEVLTAETDSCSLKSTYWPSSYTVSSSLPYSQEQPYNKVLLKRTRAKEKIHATFSEVHQNFPHELLHAISSSAWWKIKYSETIQYGGASHKMGRSQLLRDCMKGSPPTSLSEQVCEQEINFYCVNLLIIWNLLVTTAYLTLTSTEKNTVSWSVLQTWSNSGRKPKYLQFSLSSLM